MCRSNIKDDYFEYNELFKNFESKKIESVINSLRQPFADIAKNLDITTNTQWIVRTYLASKMILASSVMLTSAEYAESKNLRIVNPYLMYYPLLSCARAVVFTNPYQEWSDDLIAMNHSKTINIIGDIVSRYDKAEGEHIKSLINKSRIYREIYSYKFPANGLKEIELNFDKIVDICALLSEIAQLQSAILESAISKHCKEFRCYNKYSMDCPYLFSVKDDIGFFCYAFFCRICRIQKFEDCKAILDLLSAFKLCKSCCLYKSTSRME